jgi:RNA-directed DNA polymerase
VLRRQLRAALHKLRHGKPLKDGETLEHLAGYAAYLHMADPGRGAKMLDTVKGMMAQVAATNGGASQAPA